MAGGSPKRKCIGLDQVLALLATCGSVFQTGTIVASLSPSAAILDGDVRDPPDLLANVDTAQGVQDWECVR
jgi:hypothetical protein